MPTATPVPPPIPDLNTPVVDLRTGLMTPEWRKFFAFYDRIWRQIRQEIP